MPASRDIVVIGASAGGVEALQRLVGALPADLPAAVFVVLHLWAQAKSFLPQILARAGPLPARHPEDGEAFERGHIYIAPPDLHLLIEHDHVLLARGPRENRARPAINPLFRSAAAAFGPRVTGVILTGTLDDGAAGLWAVKRCGGIAVVQSDALFNEMPRSAAEHVDIDHHVRLDEIPGLLNRLTREAVDDTPRSVPGVIRLNHAAAKMKPTETTPDEVGRRSVFTCPECNGALWELDEGVLQYRCHVGHMFSAESLKESQGTTVEQSLWSALRALKDSAMLDQRLAERAQETGLGEAASRYRESSSSKMEQVALLQDFLSRVRPAQSA